jgi:tRNA 2-thiouridine synthesizing protein A
MYTFLYPGFSICDTFYVEPVLMNQKEGGPNNMTDLKSKMPSETLDVLGKDCPYPIVLIKKEMEKLHSGATLKIICDSSATVEEAIPRYCEKHGYQFEAVKFEDKGYWEFYIEKT